LQATPQPGSTAVSRWTGNYHQRRQYRDNQNNGFHASHQQDGHHPYETIEPSTTKNLKNAALTRSVSTGFTDSHFVRDIDIISCGFTLFLHLKAQSTGVHSNNERISMENLRRGTKIMTDFLFKFDRDQYSDKLAVF